MHIDYPKFLKVAFAKTLKKIIHNKKLNEQDKCNISNYIVNIDVPLKKSDFKNYKGEMITIKGKSKDIYIMVKKGPKLALKKEPDVTFDIPESVFGDIKEYCDKIIKTFLESSGSIGALFAGPPGLGKTLGMKIIANWALNNSLPVIMVDGAHETDDIVRLLEQSIGRAVILFDEFDKTFEDTDEQVKLLPYFDGVMSRKFLNILSVNKTSDLLDTIMNRPGRVHFKRFFDRIKPQEIKAVIKRLLKDKSKLDEVYGVVSTLNTVSYDTITQFCRQINISNDTALQTFRDMGLKRAWFIPNEKKEGPNVSYDIFINGHDGSVTELFEENSEKLTAQIISMFVKDIYGERFPFASRTDEEERLKELCGKSETVFEVRLERRNILRFNDEFIDVSGVIRSSRSDDDNSGYVRIYRNGVF